MHSSRRQFFSFVASLAAGVLTYAGFRPSVADDDILSEATQRLIGVFGHRESAAEIGRAYLRTIESQSWQLSDDRISHLSNCIGLSREEISVIEISELRKRVAERIRSDFSSKRTVNLHGWILSDTEVQICLLAAIA